MEDLAPPGSAVFSYKHHYHALFAALCRGRAAVDAPSRVCFRCSARIAVNRYFTHYRQHSSLRDACLLCPETFRRRSVSFVYTHLSFCLLPDHIPVDRSAFAVDRVELLARLTARCGGSPLQRSFLAVAAERGLERFTVRQLLTVARKRTRGGGTTAVKRPKAKSGKSTDANAGAVPAIVAPLEDSWCNELPALFGWERVEQPQQKRSSVIVDHPDPGLLALLATSESAASSRPPNDLLYTFRRDLDRLRRQGLTSGSCTTYTCGRCSQCRTNDHYGLPFEAFGRRGDGGDGRTSELARYGCDRATLAAIQSKLDRETRVALPLWTVPRVSAMFRLPAVAAAAPISGDDSDVVSRAFSSTDLYSVSGNNVLLDQPRLIVPSTAEAPTRINTPRLYDELTPVSTRMFRDRTALIGSVMPEYLLYEHGRFVDGETIIGETTNAKTETEEVEEEDYDDHRSPSGGSMGCLGCDLQQERYATHFCDRWPVNRLLSRQGESAKGASDFLNALEPPHDRLVRRFLPNATFRAQYDCVPEWLSGLLPRKHLREQLRFASTGVSTVMARLLETAFRTWPFVLRHVYLYDFNAREALRFLFDRPDDYYVFPFTCLCSSDCFGHTRKSHVFAELAARTTGLQARLFSVLSERSRIEEDLLTQQEHQQQHQPPLSQQQEQQQEQQQQQQQSPASTDSDDEFAGIASTAEEWRRSGDDGTARRHRSADWLEQRQRLKRRLQEYALDAAARTATSLPFDSVFCHRHAIVCARTIGLWQQFSANFCHRFQRVAVPCETSAGSSSLTRVLLVPTTFSKQFANISHVMNTVVSVSRPTQPFRFHNFYRVLGDLENLSAAWHRLTDSAQHAPARARLTELMLQKMLGSPRPYRGHTCNRTDLPRSSHTTKLQLLNRTGRFFLYEVLSGNTSNVASARDRYRLFVQSFWQPKCWENDHFYIATPIIEHGQVMYWIMADNCLVEQLNLMFGHRDFRRRLTQLSRLACRYDERHLYTRLGYVFPYFLPHYPLEHRLPLLADRSVCVQRTKDSSVRVVFGPRDSAPQRNIRFLGDLFDLVVPFSETNNRLFNRADDITTTTERTPPPPPPPPSSSSPTPSRSGVWDV